MSNYFAQPIYIGYTNVGKKHTINLKKKSASYKVIKCSTFTLRNEGIQYG